MSPMSLMGTRRSASSAGAAVVFSLFLAGAGGVEGVLFLPGVVKSLLELTGVQCVEWWRSGVGE